MQVESVAPNPGPAETTVTFREALKNSYSAATTNVRGNGVRGSHGESHEQEATGTGRPGQNLFLDYAPLTYIQDASTGETRSTLSLTVDTDSRVEVEDFISSGPADRHYRLTRANDGYITVEFGDGTFGQTPAADSRIRVEYRSGVGESGLVAKNTLTQVEIIENEQVVEEPSIDSVTNPLPSSGAKEPESLAEARLIAPRAGASKPVAHSGVSASRTYRVARNYASPLAAMP